MVIDTLENLFNLFPNWTFSGGIYRSPCPFCDEPLKRSFKNNHLFCGEDRFVRDFRRYDAFYCTHCRRVYTVDEIASQLDVTLKSDFDNTIPLTYLREKKEIWLTDAEYISTLHSNVQRDFWYSFGWSDHIIDKFQLGYGTLYPNDDHPARHTIPFIPYTGDGPVNGYAIEGRLPYGYVGKDKRNIKTAGITKEYFWQIVEGNSETAVIVEGLKDAISITALGIDTHIYAILGNATDRELLSNTLSKRLYKKVILCCHHDEAGLGYINDFVSHLTCEVYALQWPENAKSGYDITDLLVDLGPTDAKEYINNNLYAPQLEIPRTLVPDVRSFTPDYVAPQPSEYTSKVVREELPQVLDEFFTNYDTRRRAAGRGLIKVLAVDPGAGKSFAMVQAAEKLARQVLRDVQNTRNQLNQLIKDRQDQLLFIESAEEMIDLKAQIENLVVRRDNLSCAKILYAGPFINGWDDIQHLGADMSLWYNLEARNEENCENLLTVSSLANKGYNAMNFCQNACPLKAGCKYLKQLDERKSKPITYIRHQSLNTALRDEYKYIFIDENCLNIFDAPVMIDASQLYPVYDFWSNFIEPDQKKLIVEFIDAIRLSMNANVGKHDVIYSGRLWMDLVNDQLLGKLVETLSLIKPKNMIEYQPSTVMGEFEIKDLPNRCVPVIYEAMLRELPLYTSRSKSYNSSINLVNGQLEVYPLQRAHIASSHPIVIADGTSFPQLYDLLFDREVEIYAPPLYDPRTSTTIFYGSDFTRTSLLKQIGKGLKDFSAWLQDSKLVVEDIFGEEFDLSDLPIDENMYDSPTMKRVISLLKMVADKHESVLFVTYKNIRILVEKRMKELYPDLVIHYGHYGALRGTNRYKDVEAVLLVGCPRVGYDALYRKIKAWASLAQKSYIPFRLIQKVAPYHGVGVYAGHPYITIDDDFADRFISMVEAGEVRQAMERIRLTTSVKPKAAYLAISRPAAKWITDLQPMAKVSDVADRDRQQKAINFIRSVYTATGKFPTYAKITKEYKIGASKVAEIIKEIKSEAS